jgi:hypothetical protein
MPTCGRVSPSQYDRVVREAVAPLDEAVERVVPKERRASLSFRGRVLADLLLGMASEYDEAYKAGAITQAVEYQDAYAFFKRAQAAHRDLAPALRAKDSALAADLDQQFAALARALPGLTPPTPLTPADRMQATVGPHKSLRQYPTDRSAGRGAAIALRHHTALNRDAAHEPRHDSTSVPTSSRPEVPVPPTMIRARRRRGPTWRGPSGSWGPARVLPVQACGELLAQLLDAEGGQMRCQPRADAENAGGRLKETMLCTSTS